MATEVEPGKEKLTTLIKRLYVLEPAIPSMELLDKQARGKRWETIEVPRIQTDVLINDSIHVSDLSKSIFGSDGNEGFGQINPINAAVFKDNTRGIYYMPTDGYHRIESFLIAKEPNIESIVLYGLTLEEVYDLRILAANSTGSTRFSRVAEWMQKIFELTKWSKEKHLSLVQAFSLATQGTKGTRLDLTQEEAKELKGWVKEKAGYWGKKVGSIWADLVIISKADPDLVRSVRIGGGGGHGPGKGKFNRDSLKAIVDALPDEFVLQQLTAQLVTTHNFNALQTAGVAKAMAEFKNDDEVLELIRSHALSIAQLAPVCSELDNPWDTVKNLIVVAEYHGLNQSETVALGQAVLGLGEDDELLDAIYEDPRKYFVKQGSNEVGLNSVLPGKRKVGGFSRYAINGMQVEDNSAGYVRDKTTVDYEIEINRLKEIINTIQESGKGISWKDKKRSWWKLFPDFTDKEQQVFDLVFGKKLGVKKAAKELNDLTENQIAVVIKSGLSKYMLAMKDEIESWADKTMYGAE